MQDDKTHHVSVEADALDFKGLVERLNEEIEVGLAIGIECQLDQHHDGSDGGKPDVGARLGGNLEGLDLNEFQHGVRIVR